MAHLDDDAGGLLSFEVEGVRQLTQAFDVASRVTSRAIGAQDATTYTYNGDGRLATVDAPDAAPVQYAYTASGQLASVTDARGTTSYSYDSRSRLSEVAAPEGSVGYTYDAASRVATVSTSAGVTSYVRDALGRVTGVTDPAGGHYALTRDDAGRVVSVGFPNGVSEAYTYDAAGRPLTVTVAQGGAVLGSFEVTRDDAGRIATFLDAFDTNTQSGSFGYDAGGRLTGATSTDGTSSSSSTFTLDAAGNRTAVTGDGAETASFNALDQLVSGGGATYVYDASGFLRQITDGTGTTDLSYSSAGQLLGVNGPGGAVSYAYDPSGVLTSRTDGTGTVGFVNDASMSLPHPVAGTDGSWWVYAGSRPLAQATPDGQVHYLHEDPRGDVRLVTDAAGAVTDTFTYSVDGEVTARTGTTTVSVGWNGEYTDPATGMVWLRARWYDPASARFITADPWQGNPANPVSLNRYLFANADPVNNTDPSGMNAYTLPGLNATMVIGSIVRATATISAVLLLGYVADVTITRVRDGWPATRDRPDTDSGIDNANKPEPAPKPQPEPIWPPTPTDRLQCDDANDPSCTDRWVIGESSVRTRGAAVALDAQVWVGVPPGTSHLDTCAANLAWIEQAMDRGAIIYDIGIDASRQGSRSPYYELERVAVLRRGYPTIPTPWPPSPSSYAPLPQPECPM